MLQVSSLIIGRNTGWDEHEVLINEKQGGEPPCFYKIKQTILFRHQAIAIQWI